MGNREYHVSVQFLLLVGKRPFPQSRQNSITVFISFYRNRQKVGTGFPGGPYESC